MTSDPSIVVILFADSVNRSFKTQEKHDRNEDHNMGGRSDSYLHAKLFQAQRNMYLTGSVIFLSLVLNRFYNMIVELAKNEEKTEVQYDLMKGSQAASSKDYERKLLDKDQKQVSSGKELEDKEKECVKLVKELDIVKKQATQTHEAYMRLTDEFNALEKKGTVQESKKDS